MSSNAGEGTSIIFTISSLLPGRSSTILIPVMLQIVKRLNCKKMANTATRFLRTYQDTRESRMSLVRVTA